MAISQTRTLKTGITSEDVLNFEPVYVYIYMEGKPTYSSHHVDRKPRWATSLVATTLLQLEK
jgi:hypothetical protein